MPCMKEANQQDTERTRNKSPNRIRLDFGRADQYHRYNQRAPSCDQIRNRAISQRGWIGFLRYPFYEMWDSIPTHHAGEETEHDSLPHTYSFRLSAMSVRWCRLLRQQASSIILRCNRVTINHQP